MKNKGFITILIIYIIFFIGDVVSTFRGGLDKAKILEANFLIKYIGFVGIIALNIGVIILFYWYYNKKDSPTLKYMLIVSMFYIILIRCYVIYNNWQWGLVDIPEKELIAIATTERKVETVKTLAFFYYVPFITNIIPFLIWRCDHEITKK